MRPTADRVREALFARMADLEGVAVLDLYAGTGALGIEALSRGADNVVFVERAAASVAVLRRNLERLELTARARVLRDDVSRALRRLAREGRRFDLVLADPPYAASGVEDALSRLASGGILPPGGTLVVERGRRHPLAAIPGLVEVESRRYGDTVVVWLTRESVPPRYPIGNDGGRAREGGRGREDPEGPGPRRGKGKGEADA